MAGVVILISRHFFFKASKFKAKFTLTTDEARILFYDDNGRCKGLVSSTASIYHPLIRSLVPPQLPQWKVKVKTVIQSSFTEKDLRKESPNEKYFFIFVAGLLEGLRQSVGPHALETVKTIECYFLRLSNEEERIRRHFKQLCNR